jgi:hypothetical protein
VQNCYERCSAEFGVDYDAISRCLMDETGYRYTPKELKFYEENIFP